ncbi:MAG TPA: zinc dependent phospholipase C family protein, partial [Polyangiaceae bacterium]
MCRAFLLKLVVAVSSLFLFGFGVPTHTAISNQTLDELEESLNGAEPELVFHDLAVAITQDRRAYDAILAHPEFFRMGAAGPDAFPELVSGQLFHHVNQGVLPEDSESPAVASHRPFEDRTPNTFRSIDVAMRMLNFAVTGPHKDDPRVLAFAMGFVTHSVGDGFMHPRVNELANGYFTLLAGEGAFDEITEEVKHTAIEELLDQVVPAELKNSDPNVDSSDRFDMRAPVAFLDDFYRQGAASDRVGGPIYDWFAIQDDALKAAIVAVDPIRALPSLEDLIREVLLGALDDVTGGALGFGALNAAVEQVMDMLPRDQLVSLASETNLLGFKAEELEKKLIAYRKNMILLSECTMRNLAQASATVEVVDHCASADTLSRIDLNGVVDLTGLFRLELEDLFRGTELEPAPPRSRGFNIRRLIAYAKSSFKLADAIEILIPISISDAITLVRQFVQNNRETINQ